jgi:hypothetical protein
LGREDRVVVSPPTPPKSPLIEQVSRLKNTSSKITFVFPRVYVYLQGNGRKNLDNTELIENFEVVEIESTTSLPYNFELGMSTTNMEDEEEDNNQEAGSSPPHDAYLESNARQLAEVTPLFIAYRLEQSQKNEDALLTWVMMHLRRAAKRKYYAVWGVVGEYMVTESEVCAATATITISHHLQMDAEIANRKLEDGDSSPKFQFETSENLLRYMGRCITNFSSPALTKKLERYRFLPLFVSTADQDGEEEYETGEVTHQRMKATVGNTGASEHHEGLALTPVEVSNLMTRENVLLRRCLSTSQIDLLSTLEAHEWKRDSVALEKGLVVNTLDQKIKRLGEHFTEIKALMACFKLAGEHRRDLVDRFMQFVNRLQAMPHTQMPMKFDQAIAECANPHALTGVGSLQSKDKIVKHLLKLRTQALIQ